ncbi:MAG: hypothetical protein GKR91_20645 [Pseudomonadales bacterium]|nr:hypothetical protein [Pseudomonadales bacterium]
MTELIGKVSGDGPVRKLEIDIAIKVPIQKVWDAITLSDQVQQWWTAGTIEAHEGGSYVLEGGEAVKGTVKLCFPPYLFAFTWNDDPGKSKHPHLVDAATNSTIIFELIELNDEETSLNFVQYLPPSEIVGAAAGWHQILGERLKGLLETGNTPAHEDRFEELQKRYREAGIS